MAPGMATPRQTGWQRIPAAAGPAQRGRGKARRPGAEDGLSLGDRKEETAAGRPGAHSTSPQQGFAKRAGKQRGAVAGGYAFGRFLSGSQSIPAAAGDSNRSSNCSGRRSLITRRRPASQAPSRSQGEAATQQDAGRADDHGAAMREALRRTAGEGCRSNRHRGSAVLFVIRVAGSLPR